VAADPNIATGIYPLDISLSYSDSNGTKTQSSRVGLLIGGETDFEVSADTLTSGQTSFSIANIGSNNADAVVAKIPSQPGVIVTGSSTIILGNLNKGDYTIANFQIQTIGVSQDNNYPRGSRTNPVGETPNQNTFAQARSVVLEIDYTDTTGERQQVMKTIQLSSSDTNASKLVGFRAQQNNSLGIIPWIILIILVGAGIVFNKIKKKTNWKKVGVRSAIIVALFAGTIFLLNSNLIAIILVTIISIAILVETFFKKEVMEKLEKFKTTKKSKK